MRAVTQVFGAKVVDYALKFAVSVLIARYLGPADKGVLSFATLVVTWIVTIGNLGFFDANIYLLGSRRYSLSEAAMTSFALSLVSGLLYALLLFVIVGFRFVRWPVGRPEVLFILLTAIPLNILVNNSFSILQGISWFKLYNVLTVAGSLVYLLTVLAARHLAQDHLVGIVVATVGSNIFAAATLAICLGKAANWKLRFSSRYLKEGLLYGIRGHLRMLLVLFTQMFDQFVVGALLAPTYLGWYSVAVGLSAGLLMLPDSVSLVLFPRVAANQTSGAALTARACRCTVLVMVAGAVGGFVLGRPGIALLYGKQFLPSAIPFYIMLVAIIFQAASRILRNYFYGVGRPQLTLWSSGAAALVTATAIFPLVRSFGMVGAAASALLAHGVGAVVDLIVAVRLSAAPARQFVLPQRTDFQIAAWKP